MGESIISTCMSSPGKTKDNMKARKDLTELCNCPSLELKVTDGKPHAPFCLKPQQRKEIMRWMKGMKFCYLYAASLRRSVNMTTGKLIGLKRHDYHIILERILPIMFQGYLDDAVWMVFIELSYFYRQLCAKEIAVQMTRSWRRRYQYFYARWRKIFLLGFLIQCIITLYIFHMKLKWVVLLNIGGFIILKEHIDILNQWLAIGPSPSHCKLPPYLRQPDPVS
jgi:hypothetical protein